MKITAAATFAFFLFASKLGYSQVDARENSLLRAVAFLKNQQDESGRFADSSNLLFDVWETILATDALQHLNTSEHQAAIDRSNAFLKSQENDQGLICHNSKCKDATCIETSAYYLALRRNSYDADLQERLRLIAAMQEADGSWKILNPDVYEKVSFVSVTAFVVNLFKDYNYSDYNKKAALEYIGSQQLDDGSWGQTWEYYNCPGYALWQCLQVLRDEPEYVTSYQKGREFILKQQLADGSWHYRDANIENTTSPELQTAIMLRCLAGDQDPGAQKAFEQGIAYLQDRQLANGSWDGGNFPIPNARYQKKEYLLATSLIIQSFSDVLNEREE